MNNAQVLRDALTGAMAATGKDTEILDAVHIRVADRVLHVVGTDRFIVAMHAAPTDMEDFAQVSISTAEAKRLLKNLAGVSYVALQVDGDTLHVQADGDLDGYQILYGQAPDFTKMGQRYVPCPNAFTRLNSGIFAALAKLPENKKKGLAFDVEILGMSGDQHHNTLPKMMRFTRGAWTFMAMLQRHEGCDMDEIWDHMIESGLFTQEELSLLSCLYGYTRETLLDAWFVRTGEREIEPCE